VTVRDHRSLGELKVKEREYLSSLSGGKLEVREIGHLSLLFLWWEAS